MRSLIIAVVLLTVGCAAQQRNPIVKADTEDCKLVYNNIVNIVARDTEVFKTDIENDALRELISNQFHASRDYDRFMAACNNDASVEQTVCGAHAETLEAISGCMKLIPSAKQGR